MKQKYIKLYKNLAFYGLYHYFLLFLSSSANRNELFCFNNCRLKSNFLEISKSDGGAEISRAGAPGTLKFRPGIHYRVLSPRVLATSGQDVVEPPFSGGCLQISAIMRLSPVASRFLPYCRVRKQ